jgi:hypothetical protein
MQSRLQQGSAAPRLSRNRRMCKTLINKDFQDQAVRNCTKSAITPKEPVLLNRPQNRIPANRIVGHLKPGSNRHEKRQILDASLK